MIKTNFFGNRKLPLVIEPGDGTEQSSDLQSLIALCVSERDFLRDQLLKCGALLLRGYAVRAAHEFAQVVRSFSDTAPLDYIGGASPRIKLDGGVYTSTEYPAHYTLSLHNELSYTYKWPAHLYFCCLMAPQQGGETPLADSRALLKSIEPEVVHQFRTKKIRYERNLHGGSGVGLSWQAAFETDDKSIVENYCREGHADFKWKDDGGLWTSQARPVIATHMQTGEEVWFNQADGFHTSGMDQATYQTYLSNMKEEDFPLNARFGEGAPLDPSMLDHIREVMSNEMTLFSWQAGDVLILDNMLAAHGRMPFSGPRKILLAMT